MTREKWWRLVGFPLPRVDETSDLSLPVMDEK
jgi:hypothetical protein